MNTTLIKILPCIVWGAVAISSSTPADAYALTTQNGDYAACSQDYEPLGSTFECDAFWVDAAYIQRIKLVGTSCSQGGCNPDWETVYVDFLYGSGRHIAHPMGSCHAGLNRYGLDTCAC